MGRGNTGKGRRWTQGEGTYMYKVDIGGEKLDGQDQMENRGLYMGRTCRPKHTHHLLHIPYGEKLCPHLCNIVLQS